MSGSSAAASWRSGSVTKYGDRKPLSNCMPSVSSSSMPKVFDSSTVTVPSLPTLSMASASTSPMAGAAAEIDATWAISVLPSTSLDCLARSSTAALTAFSIPRFSPVGLAPAATLRSPSVMRAWARTVAVVVPSPATSLVLVATSLASWAPRFSCGSSSSISRATVTPSLVMVGAPHFLSITTLRPLGPSVTLTASARRLTPRSSDRRASSSNSKLLAIGHLNTYVFWMGFIPPPRARLLAAPGGAGRARAPPSVLLDDRGHVAGGEHQVLLAAVLDLGAAVLAVQHDVADADVHGDALGACIIEPAGANREDFALLGLLLCGVRDNQARSGGLLGFERAHHDPVFERLENNLGGGRHDLTSPSGKG